MSATALRDVQASGEPAPSDAGSASCVTAPPPDAVVTTEVAARTRTLWPFTGVDFSGSRSDPVNLVFIGHADPRNIRSALMSLSGEREGAFAGFGARWTDAIGEFQTSYSARHGWEGSVIQLQCGDYGSLRVHLRLFAAGDWTIANAHVDVLIPRTPQHQVVSWEVAREFVVQDLVRGGLLASAPSRTGPLYEPWFRTVPYPFFAQLPVELQVLIGGTSARPGDDVPMPTGRTATVLEIREAASPAPGTSQEVVSNFDRVVPRPLSKPGSERFMAVQGQVVARLDVEVGADGSLAMELRRDAHLRVTPVNPQGEPTGAGGDARICDRARGTVQDGRTSLSVLEDRRSLSGGGEERIAMELHVGPHGLARHSVDQGPRA